MVLADILQRPDIKPKTLQGSWNIFIVGLGFHQDSIKDL